MACGRLRQTAGSISNHQPGKHAGSRQQERELVAAGQGGGHGLALRHEILGVVLAVLSPDERATLRKLAHAILDAMSDVEQSVVEELVGNAHGNLVRVRELLDAHPEALNLRAPWNETAVQAATQMGNKRILELLIARGAPVDFFTACVLGRIEQVAAELERDPSRANARGVHELPALYFAGIGGDTAIADLLLAAGADINARSDAAAPIHGAVMGGGAEMVRLLLKKGADPTLLDYEGRGARQLAEKMGRSDLAALLDPA